MPPTIDRLDHLVLTVADLEKSIEFYTRVLGMRLQTAGNRKAVRFGDQKINLHQLGREFEPKAHIPTPGSGDLCFIVTDTLEDVVRHLELCSVVITEGPVERTGALGTMTSIYIRDPDSNLIELSNYL